jgi:hypothetical protein
MAHDMILEEEFILGGALDEEEEPEEAEEGEATIDDELLGELGDGAAEDDELIAAEIDPLLKADETGFGEIGDHDDPEKEHASLEDDEDDEEDMDYDSFDDRDEM